MASAWLCLSVVCCTDTSLAFNMPQPNPCLKQRLVSSLYVYTSFNQVYLRISSLLLFDRIGSFSEHAEKRKTISIKIVYKKIVILSNGHSDRLNKLFDTFFLRC